MSYRKDILNKFGKSFSHFSVSDEKQQVLFDYVVNGMPPGSFFTAVLSNDLFKAAITSHPLNQWGEIIDMCKWIKNMSPYKCWGSAEKVEEWLALTQDQRITICENCGLVATTWDLLKE